MHHVPGARGALRMTARVVVRARAAPNAPLWGVQMLRVQLASIIERRPSPHTDGRTKEPQPPASGSAWYPRPRSRSADGSVARRTDPYDAPTGSRILRPTDDARAGRKVEFFVSYDRPVGSRGAGPTSWAPVLCSGPRPADRRRRARSSANRHHNEGLLAKRTPPRREGPPSRSWSVSRRSSTTILVFGSTVSHIMPSAPEGGEPDPIARASPTAASRAAARRLVDRHRRHSARRPRRRSRRRAPADRHGDAQREPAGGGRAR